MIKWIFSLSHIQIKGWSGNTCNNEKFPLETRFWSVGELGCNADDNSGDEKNYENVMADCEKQQCQIIPLC